MNDTGYPEGYAEDDCAHWDAVDDAPAPVAVRRIIVSHEPVTDFEAAHQRRLAAHRAYLATVGIVDTPDRRLWHDDHNAWLATHGLAVMA